MERIDLYQLHSPNPRVPFAKSVGALAELQTAGGKGRHVGLSNAVAQLRQTQAVTPIVTMQNRYRCTTSTHSSL